MVVLSAILDLAGFYQPLFLIETEASIKIEAEDGGVTVEGRIDILVLNQELVVLVIESKNTTFSLQIAVPQVMAYMLARANTNPLFSLVTNGSEFLFLKLSKNSRSYDWLRVFSILNPGNELYLIFQHS